MHGFHVILDQLVQQSDRPTDGFFGPDSVSWRVARERALYIGGLRALLMQVAHPKIAQAGYDHSNFYADPIARFHRTFAVVHGLVFGTQDEAIHAATRLYAIHQQVYGQVTEPLTSLDGQRYSATDSHLLLWVFATLVDSAICVLQQVLPPQRWYDWDAYYQESKKFALLCGVAVADVPPTRQDFHGWIDEMVGGPEIMVTPEALHIKSVLLNGAPILRTISPFYKTAAAALLPTKLRTSYGLRWNRWDQLVFRLAIRSVKITLPWLPANLRYVSAFQAATQRS